MAALADEAVASRASRLIEMRPGLPMSCFCGGQQWGVKLIQLIIGQHPRQHVHHRYVDQGRRHHGANDGSGQVATGLLNFFGHGGHLFKA